MTKMKKRSVLLVTSRLSVGGVAKSTCMLANSLCDRGETVEILRFSNEESKYDLDERIRVITVVGPDIIAKSKSKLIKGLLSIIFNICVLFVLLIKKRSIIISFRTDIVKLITRYKSLLGLLVIGSERGNPYRFTQEQLNNVRFMYELCDCVVFQTEESRNCFPSIKIRSVIIPNYCCIEKFERRHIVERKKNIVACGVPSVDKGFDILIQAFYKVAQLHPEFKLIIYGPCNEYCKELIRMTEDLNLKGNVLFKGETDCFYKLSYDASMYILSSRNEGIPNTLIEALSAGIPSISTNCSSGGPSLLLDGGNNGLLVPVEDVDELAQAMLSYIENPLLAEEYGRRGEKGLERFSETIITNKWLNVINKYER